MNFDYIVPESWRFVPIREGSKAPIGAGWQNQPFTWQECPKVGERYQGQTVGAIGLLFGDVSDGVVGLDFDGASVDPMLAEWGITLPDTSVISSGRPGHCLKLYRIPEPYWCRIQTAKYKTGAIVEEYGKTVHEQLELRWTGSQSLVTGTHPESGNPYKILQWVDELPELPAQLIHKMLKPDECKHQPAAGHDFSDAEWGRSYLKFIQPDGLDWYSWRDVLFACHSAGLSDAEVRSWSSQSGKHTDRGFDDVWRHIKGRSGVGLGTLGWLAKRGGWEPRCLPKTNSKLSRQSVPPIEPESFQDRLNSIALADENERAIRIAELHRDTGVPYGELKAIITQRAANINAPAVEAQDLAEFLGGDTDPLHWLVEGLLPAGETIILGAPPKSGKTLLTVDLAYSVTTGTPFLGMPVRQGQTLIVSTDESPSSTASKMRRRGFKPGMPCAVLTKFDIEELAPLQRALEKYRPALVVVDSLKSITKNLTVSENSPEFSNFVYRLKEVFSAYGCAAVIVHHISKNRDHTGVNKLRGSTAIAGSAWGVWLLDRCGENNTTLETISRDIEGETIPIALNQESMGWERQDSPPPTEGALTEKLLALLKSRTTSNTGLEVAEIKAALDVNSKYLYKVLTRLCEKRLIGRRESRLNKGKWVYFLPDESAYKIGCTEKSRHTHLQVNNHRPLTVSTTLSTPSGHSGQTGVDKWTPSRQPSRHGSAPCSSDLQAGVSTFPPTPGNIECQQNATIENVSTDTQSVAYDSSSTEVCKKKQSYQIRQGDWVKYVGSHLSLRQQCQHSRREGLQVIRLLGEQAVVKSPKWVCDYTVAVGDLVLDRHHRIAAQGAVQ